MEERTQERRNERTNEGTNERTNERKNTRTKERKNTRTNARTHACTQKYTPNRCRSLRNRVKISPKRPKIALGAFGAIWGRFGEPRGRSRDALVPPWSAPWMLPGRSWVVSGRSGALPERPGTVRRRVGQRSEVVFCHVRVRTCCRIDLRTIFYDFHVARGRLDTRFVCIFTSRNACGAVCVAGERA